MFALQRTLWGHKQQFDIDSSFAFGLLETLIDNGCLGGKLDSIEVDDLTVNNQFDIDRLLPVSFGIFSVSDGSLAFRRSVDANARALPVQPKIWTTA